MNGFKYWQLYNNYGNFSHLMNFRLKFWQQTSIHWPRFSYKARYNRRFEDVLSILPWIIWTSAILLLLVHLSYWLRKCVTYWVPHDDSFHQVWSWYGHALPSYSVIAAETLRDLTLWPWPFTFWPWSVVIHGGSRNHQFWISNGNSLLSYEFLHLPLDTFWQCVWSHCACTVSRDPYVGI